MKVGTIRHLYMGGLRDYEIAERTGVPLIQVKHAIDLINANIPDAESKHYINRHAKGRRVRAYIVNDDPYYEKVCRFEVAL